MYMYATRVGRRGPSESFRGPGRPDPDEPSPGLRPRPRAGGRGRPKRPWDSESEFYMYFLLLLTLIGPELYPRADACYKRDSNSDSSSNSDSR